MMTGYLISTTFLLFLVMDPFGNMPLFIATLRGVPPRRYRRIVLRESLIALGVLLLFLAGGGRILALLQISQASLGIAGGIVLFLIALKMVFGTFSVGIRGEAVEGGERQEPLIVPLAIPLIAGPSSMAMVILIQGRNEGELLWNLLALLLAWGCGTALLLTSRKIAELIGNRVLDAAESLIGLLLTALAVEMFITGLGHVNI